MKKVFFILFICISAAMANGCKKDSKVDGGFIRNYIYVLDDNTLSDAQDYPVTFPAEGGTRTLKIVSFGYLTIEGSKEGNGFSAEVANDKTSYDEVPFEDYYKVDRYVQSVNLSATANLSTTGKEFTFLIVSCAGDGYAADFHLNQSGK